MNKIARFIFFDILKNKIIIFYTLLLFIISWSVLGLEGNFTKATISLLNVVLLVVPLVSIIFSTIYVYNSGQFIALLLSQPVPRTKIWFNIFMGLSGALILAFLIGCGIPILLYSSIETGFSLIIIGIFLSIIFTSFAMLSAILSRDRAKGIGISSGCFLPLFMMEFFSFSCFSLPIIPLKELWRLWQRSIQLDFHEFSCCFNWILQRCWVMQEQFSRKFLGQVPEWEFHLLFLLFGQLFRFFGRSFNSTKRICKFSDKSERPDSLNKP